MMVFSFSSKALKPMAFRISRRTKKRLHDIEHKALQLPKGQVAQVRMMPGFQRAQALAACRADVGTGYCGETKPIRGGVGGRGGGCCWGTYVAAECKSADILAGRLSMGTMVNRDERRILLRKRQT